MIANEIKTRAQAGGEIGINGEFYEGGQFLPSSPMTINGEMQKTNSRKGSRKMEVAPYKWEVAPEGMRSIFTAIGGTVARYNRNTGEMEYLGNEQAENYFGYTSEEVISLIEKFNSGEKWM